MSDEQNTENTDPAGQPEQPETPATGQGLDWAADTTPATTGAPDEDVTLEETDEPEPAEHSIADDVEAARERFKQIYGITHESGFANADVYLAGLKAEFKQAGIGRERKAQIKSEIDRVEGAKATVEPEETR